MGSQHATLRTEETIVWVSSGKLKPDFRQNCTNGTLFGNDFFFFWFKQMRMFGIVADV